jgi:hypothetical protein
MSVLIAIDPGMSGGIAWQVDGGLPAVEKMPETERDIADLLGDLVMNLEDHCAYVEDVPIGMPGKGAASSKLNANAGFIRGVLAAHNVRVVMTRPAKWQQYFSVGKRSGCASDTEWKNKLKQVAQRLFPALKITLQTSDALLLLEYARKNP